MNASAGTSAPRVLVLDDDEALRGMLEELLGIRGFAVESASTAEEAIGIWSRELAGGAPFCAALVDLSLGEGPGGEEFARGLRKLDPSARILACTGNSADPVFCDPGSRGFDGALAKPFLVEDLVCGLDGIRAGGLRTQDRRDVPESPGSGCQNPPDNARIGAGEDL